MALIDIIESTNKKCVEAKTINLGGLSGSYFLSGRKGCLKFISPVNLEKNAHLFYNVYIDGKFYTNLDVGDYVCLNFEFSNKIEIKPQYNYNKEVYAVIEFYE